MKHKLMSIVAALSIYGVTFSMYNSNLADAQGNPSKSFLEVLRKTNLKHDGSWKSILACTDKQQPEGWIRPRGTERGQVPFFKELEQELRQEFYDTKYMEAIPAPDNIQKYDHAIVMGELTTEVRERYAFLINCWKRGIRFDQLIFLTGDRALDSAKEPKEMLVNENFSSLPFKKDWKLEDETPAPTNEYAMMKMVYEQTDIPADLQNVPLTIINAPKKPGAARATTKDAVEEMARMGIKPGSCLMISNQPYIKYQEATLCELMPKEFSIQAAGPAISAKRTTSDVLDAMARELFQLGKLSRQ